MRKNKILPKEIKEPKLTPKEKEQRNADIKAMCNMRYERDRPHTELDGMTYIQYCDSNRKKDLAYLPPKVNTNDVRISTGVTREKDTSLLSLALSMNFLSEVKAFNSEDLLINEYGDHLSVLNKKSREIEDWYKKRSIIYREQISQGDVFVHEMFVEKFGKVATSDPKWDPANEKNDIKDFKYQSKIKKILSQCEAKMISGKKIYVSNIRKEWIHEQEQVAVLNVYSREEAFSKYGTWERWNNVPNTIETTDFSNSGTYETWNIVNISQEHQVAEIMLWDTLMNRYQIYLNGVPMLPRDYLLTLVSPSGKVPISHGKNEPISNFFYSKSQPSKTKVEEDVLNESTKLMIEGMRLDNKPPMGSRKSKVLNPNVLQAGNISPDMRPGDLFSILERTGTSNASFSFHQLMKKAIDDKSVNPSFEGTDRGGDPTATQVNQEKQQQMLKLGLLLDGIMNLETQMTWFRVYGMIANWTKKHDVDMGAKEGELFGKFRSFSVDTDVDDGQMGVKIFRFAVGKEFPSIDDQRQEEEDLAKEFGKDVRIVYMDPTRMRKMKEKFFVSTVSTPQNNDLLTQIVFIQNLRQAYELFGFESINQDYAKQRYAILMNENYNKFFNKVDILELMKNRQAQAGGDRTGQAGGLDAESKQKSGKPLEAIVK